MSIDIYLSINTGKHMHVMVEVGNYTHNCQPMWWLALAEGAHVEMSLCDFDGMAADKASPLLELAVAHMRAEENRDRYVDLNPSNGWGDYETALEYLNAFYEACVEHPLCIIETSC